MGSTAPAFGVATFEIAFLGVAVAVLAFFFWPAFYLLTYLVSLFLSFLGGLMISIS